MRRGKSATPAPSVLTEDSRKESDVRREATHSPYVETAAVMLADAIFHCKRPRSLHPCATDEISFLDGPTGWSCALDARCKCWCNFDNSLPDMMWSLRIRYADIAVDGQWDRQ